MLVLKILPRCVCFVDYFRFFYWQSRSIPVFFECKRYKSKEKYYLCRFLFLACYIFSPIKTTLARSNSRFAPKNVSYICYHIPARNNLILILWFYLLLCILFCYKNTYEIFVCVWVSWFFYVFNNYSTNTLQQCTFLHILTFSLSLLLVLPLLADLLLYNVIKSLKKSRRFKMLLKHLCEETGATTTQEINMYRKKIHFKIF